MQKVQTPAALQQAGARLLLTSSIAASPLVSYTLPNTSALYNGFLVGLVAAAVMSKQAAFCEPPEKVTPPTVDTPAACLKDNNACLLSTSSFHCRLISWSWHQLPLLLTHTADTRAVPKLLCSAETQEAA
jgi:hypothetical protein